MSSDVDKIVHAACIGATESTYEEEFKKTFSNNEELALKILTEQQELYVTKLKADIATNPVINVTRYLFTLRKRLWEAKDEISYAAELDKVIEEAKEYNTTQPELLAGASLQFRNAAHELFTKGLERIWKPIPVDSKEEFKYEELPVERGVNNIYAPLRQQIKRYITTLRALQNQTTNESLERDIVLKLDALCKSMQVNNRPLILQKLYCIENESAMLGRALDETGEYKAEKGYDYEDAVYVNTVSKLVLDEVERTDNFRRTFKQIIELLKDTEETEKSFSYILEDETEHSCGPLKYLLSKQVMQVKKIMETEMNTNFIAEAIRNIFVMDIKGDTHDIVCEKLKAQDVLVGELIKKLKAKSGGRRSRKNKKNRVHRLSVSN